MPVIQPAKLKLQISELVDTYDQVEVFERKLIDLLELYADNTRRQGVVISAVTLLDSLGVPNQVIRLLSINLEGKAQKNPESTLDICDHLWKIPYVEYRLIASQLLGFLPASYKDEILSRINAWKKGSFDESIALILLKNGFSSLMQTHPEDLMQIAENWLLSSENNNLQYGVLLLGILIRDNHYENNPRAYRLITPLIRKTPGEIRSLMPSLIADLASKDAYETAYILKEALNASESPDTGWTIRQSLKNFPPEIQNNLRIALREKISQNKNSNQ